MKYSNKKKKNSSIVIWYYKFLLVFLIVFSMFFLFNKIVSNYVYNGAIKNSANSIFLKPINSLKMFNIFNYKNLLEDNANLQENLLDIKLNYNKLKDEKEDIDSLRKLTNVNLYTDYNKVFSKVLYRNKMYWFNSITIDKGYSSGIKKDSLVVGSLGLIGRVKSVSKSSSTIELISNNSDDNKLSIGIKTKEGFKYGTIESFKYPNLRIELMVDDKYINIGDIVVTSGLGNLPKGIEIGKVEKKEKDIYNLTSVLYVKPLEDMNEISYVMVLNK